MKDDLLDRLRSATDGWSSDAFAVDQATAEEAAAEIERLRTALKIVDDDIRHHLRNDSISAALIRPHAIRVVRGALQPL